MDTWDVLHTYSAITVIFVGDASMSPYEVTYEGGSVEHWNEEPGALWLKQVTDIYENCAQPAGRTLWEHTASLQIIKQNFSPTACIRLPLRA